MKKTTEMIKGNIFIIPNPAIKAATEQPKSNFEFWAGLESIWNNIVFSDKIVNSDKKFYEEKWVQVWYCTPNSSNTNWYDHLIDGYTELEGWEPVSQYLPKSLFEGKKEGDVVTFTLPICRKAWRARVDLEARIEYNDIKVSLTLCQTKYRYRNFGNFEDVLKRV